MPRSRPLFTSFTAGEWSPAMYGRADVEKYPQAAAQLRNVLIQPQGGFSRRAGTRYVAQAKAVGYDPALLPFEFGPSQSYVLELGHGYMRFFALQGQLVAASIVSGIVNGDFSAGLTGWTDTSIGGGAISVTNGDVLVQNATGTPIGNMVLGGGLAVPFGGINTALTYAYHRIKIEGGTADTGFAIARVRFYEGIRVGLSLNDGVSLGNLTTHAPYNNDQALQLSASKEALLCAQSAGSPAYVGMHWAKARRVTGFQVFASSDKAWKIATDPPTITITLQGSTDNFNTSIVQLAQLTVQSSQKEVDFFDDDIGGSWSTAARSAGDPGTIGKTWPAPKTITGFTTHSSNDHGFKRDENPQVVITLQGSNDGFATAVSLASITVADKTGPVSASIRRRASITASYQAHRLLFRGGKIGNGFAVTQVQFFEQASVVRRLRLTPGAGTAAADQGIAIAPEDLNVEHTLQFRVLADVAPDARCTVRVGSASDLGDFMPITLVGDGTHALSFLPTSSPAVLQFRSFGTDIIDIDDVALIADQPYEIKTPWAREELRALSIEQAADVMWVAHPNHPLSKLIRKGHTNWIIQQAVLVDGPYLDINLDDSITIKASAIVGNGVTLTASDPIFKPGHVGSIWRLCAIGGVPGAKTWSGNGTTDGTSTAGEYRKWERNVYVTAAGGTMGNSPPIHDRGTVSDGSVLWTFVNRDGWGYVKITAVTSATVAVANVKVRLDPSVITGAGTAVWREGAFSDYRGWPEAVALVGDRLFLSRGINFFMSSLSLFDDFSPTGEDDGAIYGTLAGSVGAPIRWAKGHQRIVMGTAKSPWVIRASGEDEALSPGNAQTRQQNAAGSSELPAFVAEEAVLYFSQSRRRVYELSTALDPSGAVGYKAVDITVLSSHILGTGALRGWLAREPHPLIWVLCEDGSMATLTYNQAESVVGWSKQTFELGQVVSHAIIPGANDDQAKDEVWLCVNRTVAGETVRYIEFVEAAIGIDDAPEDSWYVDCGVRSHPTQDIILTPGTNADQQGATGVVFTTDVPIWSDTDVGRLIRQSRHVGKGEITAVLDNETVEVTIITAFNTLDPIPGGHWALSSATYAGLDHLEGETVRILADGGEHQDRVVQQGAVKLQDQFFEVVVGLRLPWRYQGLPLASGAASGTAIGASKRASRAFVGLVNSGECDLGYVDSEGAEGLEAVVIRPVTSIGEQVPLYTGLAEVEVAMPFDKNPSLLMFGDGVRPVTVTHIVLSDLSVEESA